MNRITIHDLLEAIYNIIKDSRQAWEGWDWEDHWTKCPGRCNITHKSKPVQTCTGWEKIFKGDRKTKIKPPSLNTIVVKWLVSWRRSGVHLSWHLILDQSSTQEWHQLIGSILIAQNEVAHKEVLWSFQSVPCPLLARLDDSSSALILYGPWLGALHNLIKLCAQWRIMLLVTFYDYPL